MSAFSEQTFRLQEAARERNKQEQRKLTCNLKGKGGPEAVYRFNLEKLNQEQRLIARDLGRMRGAGRVNLAAQTPTPLALHMAKEERMIEKQLQMIRQGVHKHPGSHALLTPDKKFHHPDFSLLLSGPTEKHSGKSSNEGTNQVKSKNKFNGETSHKKLPLSKDDSDVNGFMIMEYLDNLPASTSEQDKITQKADTPLNAGVNQNAINEVASCSQTEENGARKRNDSDEIERTRADQLGSFLSSPSTTVGTIRFVSSGIDLGSRRLLDSVDPSVQRKSLSGGANRTQVQRNIGDFRAFSEEDMSKFRADANRRLSKDMNSSARKSSLKYEIKSSGTKSEGKSIGAAKSIDATKDSSDLKAVAVTEKMERDVSKPTNDNVVPERRLSKTQAMEELLKKPVYDPEMYNPDGTLKTMHTMPSFQDRWEQAQNARYIRTNAPMERDRELSTGEIFDKRN